MKMMSTFLALGAFAIGLRADTFDFSYSFSDHTITGQFTGTMGGDGCIFDASGFNVLIDGLAAPWATSDGGEVFLSNYQQGLGYTGGGTFADNLASCDFFLGNSDFGGGAFGANWYFGIYRNESGDFLASLIMLGWGAIPVGDGEFIPQPSYIVHDTSPDQSSWTLINTTEAGPTGTQIVPDGFASWLLAAPVLALLGICERRRRGVAL